MAANIGNEAFEAIQELRHNPWFVRLLNGLGEHAYDLMVAAVAGHPDVRVEQTSYARGVYDVWSQMLMAYEGKNAARGKPPRPERIRVNQPEPPNAA